MTPPTQRELRNPYFLLRTPDGLGSYLSRNNYRLLKAPNEPLAAFLADARLNEESRPAVLEYDLSSIDLETLEPMEFLPGSLIESFSAAAEQFVNQLKGRDGRVSDHVRRIWEGFRLPDPDIEKDAYWVYGPANNRQLLILWGCEFRQGASLPLTAEHAEHAGGSLLEKLRGRRPSWSSNQAAALQLIREQGLPLSRFLGELERDETGEPAQIIMGGKAVKVKDAKPMGHLSKDEVEAFKDEARELCRKARGDELGEYANELIKAFRLPDPESHPNLYFQVKGQMVVALDGPLDEATSLHPIADPQLGIPEKEKGITPPTIADRLEKRTERSKMPIYIAAMVALLLIAAAGAWYFLFFDSKPPEVTEVIARDDPTKVRVVFNEPVDEDSIDIEDEEEPSFRVQLDEGPFVDILDFAVSDEEANVVVLTVEPLAEKEYQIIAQGVKDSSGNAMVEALELEFEYRDTIPPEVAFISAHESDSKALVIGFTKELDEGSVRPGAFKLPGFNPEGAELSEDRKVVRVTFDERFENGRDYTLTVDGVSDATEERNEIADDTEEIFTYLDTLPPVLDRASADRSQIVVRAFFNEPLDEATSVNPLSYKVVALDVNGAVSEEIDVTSARLLGDDKTVEMYTSTALKPGINYQLQFTNIRDRAEPANTAEEGMAGFVFQGREDRTPPQIASLEMKVEGGEQFVAVEFEEPVEEEGALQPSNYSIPTHPVSVTSVEPTGNPARFVLRLSETLPEAATVRVQVIGVTDLIGNTLAADRPAAEDFLVPGLGNKATDLQITGQVQVSSDGQTLRVSFNEDLVAGPASITTNFRLSGGNRIASAALDPAAPNTVVITLDPGTPLSRGAHRLQVSNQRLDLIPEDVQWDRVADFAY